MSKLGVEMYPAKFSVAVETKFNRLGVLTSPRSDADDTYPELPNPATVDVKRLAGTIVPKVV